MICFYPTFHLRIIVHGQIYYEHEYCNLSLWALGRMSIKFTNTTQLLKTWSQGWRQRCIQWSHYQQPGTAVRSDDQHTTLRAVTWGQDILITAVMPTGNCPPWARIRPASELTSSWRRKGTVHTTNCNIVKDCHKQCCTANINYLKETSSTFTQYVQYNDKRKTVSRVLHRFK